MIQIRPRSSNVIATGLTMSGSRATSSTVNPRAPSSANRLGRRERRSRRPGLLAGNEILAPHRPFTRASVASSNAKQRFVGSKESKRSISRRCVIGWQLRWVERRGRPSAAFAVRSHSNQNWAAGSIFSL